MTCNNCQPVNNPCPIYANAICIIYTGSTLPCTGIVTNDRLNSILAKIDAKLCVAANAVTDFSAGDLSPLFTTSVATSTTTPALSFTLSDASAYSIYGNNTGSTDSPTFFSPILASALFQNQGTTNTLLHGNAAGNPSWAPVDLSNDVTGNLAVSHLNGGTNADSTTFWRGDGTWQSGGSGGARFGIEDNTGIQNRLNNMQGLNFEIDSIGNLALYSGDLDFTGVASQIIMNANATQILTQLNSITTAGVQTGNSFGGSFAEMLASNSVETASIVVNTDGQIDIAGSDYVRYHRVTGTGTINQTFATPADGNYYIPVSVNGNFADNTGDITFSVADNWKTVLSAAFGSLGGIGSTTTTYAQITGRAGAYSVTEIGTQYVITENCQIQRLFVAINGTQPGTGSLVVTLRLNGADTALTVTIPALATTGVTSDIVHSVSLTAGDLICYQVVNNAGTTSATIVSIGATLIQTT